MFVWILQEKRETWGHIWGLFSGWKHIIVIYYSHTTAIPGKTEAVQHLPAKRETWIRKEETKVNVGIFNVFFICEGEGEIMRYWQKLR